MFINLVTGGNGGGATAGVTSLNDQKGDLKLKTVNNNDLLGEGNIEIQAGVTSKTYYFLNDSTRDPNAPNAHNVEVFKAFDKAVQEGGSFNNFYIVHGKEVLKDQKCERYFKCLGEDLFEITEDDYFDDLSDVAYHVYFSANGTYVCYFLNGTIDTRNWKWEDAECGILRFYDYDGSSGIRYGGYDTVRFAGSQMRIYEDFTEYEDDVTVRLIAVNTFTAS